MSKKLLILLWISLSMNSFAADPVILSAITPVEKHTDSAKFQKAKEEFKAYLSKLPQATRDEIASFRTDVAKLNREKRDLYKKLSQESQDYLKGEQDFKKRYSLKTMKTILNDDSSLAKEKPEEKTVPKK